MAFTSDCFPIYSHLKGMLWGKYIYLELPLVYIKVTQRKKLAHAGVRGMEENVQVTE